MQAIKERGATTENQPRKPKIYHGARCRTGNLVEVLLGGDAYKLPNHAADRSPTGFEWGYCGSGPYALAYSILKDFLGWAIVPEGMAHALEEGIIARLLKNHWAITHAQLERFYREWDLSTGFSKKILQAAKEEKGNSCP